MDAEGDWLFQLLRGVIPPDYWQFLLLHVFHPRSYAQILRREAVANAHKLMDTVYPILEPLLERVSIALYSSPDIVVLGFVLVVLFVILQILNWMRRVVMFWTRLAFRMASWALVVALASLVYQRGVEATLRDLVAIGGKLLGYAAVVRDLWLDEYRNWEAQVEASPRGYQPGHKQGHRSGVR